MIDKIKNYTSKAIELIKKSAIVLKITKDILLNVLEVLQGGKKEKKEDKEDKA